MEQSPLRQATMSSHNEIPCILCNPKVRYRVHNSLPFPPSWARSIQSTLRPILFLDTLILSSHLRLGPPKWSLSLRSPHQNPVCICTLPHTCYVLRPSHSRFDHPDNIAWGYISWCCSLCSLLQFPVTSFSVHYIRIYILPDRKHTVSPLQRPFGMFIRDEIDEDHINAHCEHVFEPPQPATWCYCAAEGLWITWQATYVRVRVRVTIVAVGKQNVLHILNVCL